ncbi:MAG TPA: CBS domain-containing protein [Candidatus Altiarchaeales archaeon]|nr:CBS domain-containing protein [Candidatus Altiarchaeales archaeon]
MNANEIMTRGIMTIKKDAAVAEAMKTMVDRRVTSLVVEKDFDSDVYGIITRKDIVNKVIAYGKDLKKTKVSDIMTEPLMTISPDMSIENIARLMAKTDIRRFPVMEGNKIIGMVSNSDILKAIALEELENEG